MQVLIWRDRERQRETEREEPSLLIPEHSTLALDSKEEGAQHPKLPGVSQNIRQHLPQYAGRRSVIVWALKKERYRNYNVGIRPLREDDLPGDIHDAISLTHNAIKALLRLY